ncbi:MAG: RNA polymerase sigma factor [Ruminococcaceae bacterium]|nr:RNA polymerase sigma factor [Oscillospiraceae bacterium]
MDREEIHRLYDQYADTVYRVCFTYLGSASDSEDAVQEVFLRLIRKQPTFSSERDQRGWLIVTACNYCKTLLRWRKRHPVADPDRLPEQSCSDSSDAEVMELLAALPHDCRQVVYMHCCEGYSLAEIARLSGTNQSTVRSRWFYARRRLKNILGGIEE